MAEHSLDIVAARQQFRHLVQKLHDTSKYFNNSADFTTLFSTCVQLYRITAADNKDEQNVVVNFPERSQRRKAAFDQNLICLSVVKCISERVDFIALTEKYFLRCLINPDDISTDILNHLSSSSSYETTLYSVSPDGKEVSWIYPLIPNVTTCFFTTYGGFIFPDLSSDLDNKAFGILNQDFTPNGDSDEFRSILEQILNPDSDVVAYQGIHQDTSRQLDAQDAGSVQIEPKYQKAAEYISNGINWAGEKMANFVSWGAPQIQTRIVERREQSAELVHPAVSEDVSYCLKKAKTVAEKSSHIADRTIEGYNTALGHIGNYLAPHVNYLGVKTFEEVLGKDTESAKRSMETLSTTALGIHHVYSSATDALRNSAALVGNEIGENSLKLIESSYGPSVGAAAHDAYDTLKGAVNTAQTIKSLAPRDLPKKVAKSTVLHIGHARQSNDLYPKIKNLGDNILLLSTNVANNPSICSGNVQHLDL